MSNLVFDTSIFTPSTTQLGFRRSELLPSINNDTDAAVQGTTTFHFSIRADPARPLNYSHNYELVFIETNDYSSHVFTLKTGVPFGSNETVADAETFRMGSSTASGDEKVLWEVAVGRGWHNWAVENNWDESPCRNTKTPAPPSTDVSLNGFQETGIYEGLIYGGIFVEDSSSGGVTTKP
ncbi:hypothetical protein RUND412_000360 [Rhizina undulata]